MKVLFLLALHLGVMYSTIAQTTLDRNRLLDYFQSQQFEEAITYLKSIAENDTTDLQTLGYLAYAYNMVDDSRLAAEYYNRILSIDSNNISANINLANIYISKNPESAEILASRLIRLQPQNAAHYVRMGHLQVRKNLRDSAIVFFEKAYTLAPSNPRCIASFAEVLLDLRQYSLADSVLASGHALDSMNMAYLVLDVRSGFETENYEKAIVAGEKIMQLNELHLKSLLNVAVAYYNLDRYDECIRVCDYLRGQEVDGEAVNYYEAKARAKLKDYTRSNELLRACLESAVSKKAEMYYYALADNYEELGKYKSAIAHYDTAYYLFKDPLMKYNIGRLYDTKLKNSEMAAKNYRRYLLAADTSTPDRKKVYHYLDRRYPIRK